MGRQQNSWEEGRSLEEGHINNYKQGGLFA
jgi:hypothetical protein